MTDERKDRIGEHAAASALPWAVAAPGPVPGDQPGRLGMRPGPGRLRPLAGGAGRGRRDLLSRPDAWCSLGPEHVHHGACRCRAQQDHPGLGQTRPRG